MILRFLAMFVFGAFGSITPIVSASETPRLPALFALDDYAACMRGAGDVYCAVRAKIVRGNDVELMNNIQNYSKTHTHFDYSYVERGLCVKKACPELMTETTNDSQMHSVLQTCLNDSMAKKYDVEINLFGDYFCDNYKESKSLSGMAWLVVAVLIAVLVVNVVGTFKAMYPENERNPYLEAFSIVDNWKKLTRRTVEFENSRSTFLKALDGARAILFFIIIIPHNLISIGVFTENPQDFEKGFEENFIKYIASGLSVVQVHFTISGFLLVYNLETLSEKQSLSWKSFPLLFVYRWLRLAPPYILVLLVTAHVFPLMGSGPLWKMYPGYMASDCHRYFWHHLFFVNNYVPMNQCLIHTWHIAADTQAFSAGLLVYLLTRGRWRWLATAALLALGLLIPSLQIWLQDLEGITIMTPELFRTIYSVSFRHFHVLGQNNLACFALGMLAGLLAHRWRAAPRAPAVPAAARFWQGVLWLVIPLLLVSVGGVSRAQLPAPPPAAAARAAHFAAHQLALGAVTALALLAFTTDVTCGARRLLEWRGWRAAGGAAFCCYLLHLHFVYYWVGSRTALAPVSLLHLAALQAAVYAGSLALGVALHVLVEAPAGRLARVAAARALPAAHKKQQ